MTTLPNKVPSKSPSNVASSFIKKTYEILEDQKFTEIVDWNDEGTALVIKKPMEFGQKVLPTYFKHSNLTSFVRQLNMYDFHKRRTPKYDHVYYHDRFLKDQKHLLKDIKRKSQENTIASIQKAIDALESVKEGDKKESTGYKYENQLLKKLNKDALARIVSLEAKVKDLTVQNQALWYQITHQNQKEDAMVSIFASFVKRKVISLDQLPKILTSKFNLVSGEKDMQVQAPSKEAMLMEPEKQQDLESAKSLINVANFFNFGNNSRNLTNNEISPISKPMNRPINNFAPLENPSFSSLSNEVPKRFTFENSELLNEQTPMNNQDWGFQHRKETQEWTFDFQNTPALPSFDGKQNFNFEGRRFPENVEIQNGKRRLDFEMASQRPIEKRFQKYPVSSNYTEQLQREEEPTFDARNNFMKNMYDGYNEGYPIETQVANPYLNFTEF